MSFLAQLRQPPGVDRSAQHLCYCLSQDHRRRLTLSLVLASLHDHKPIPPGTPYVIKRQHLNQPPSFLSPEDVTVITQLMNTHSGWLECDQGHQLPSDAASFLATVVNAGKTVFVSPNAAWRSLQWGPALPIEWEWTIDPAGYQQPRWRIGKARTLVFAGSQPLAFDAEGAFLHPTVTGLTPDQLDRVHSQSPLAPEEVRGFRAETDSPWHQQGLALPVELREDRETCQAQPVLHFGEAGEDRLRLGFRYHHADLCLIDCRPGNPDDSRVWTGDRLLRLEPEQGRAEACIAELEACLDGFSGSLPSAYWYAETEQSWRTLLLEHRPRLESLGFAFQFYPGFKHHFVAVDHWTLSLNPDDNGQLALDLVCQVEGNRLRMAELLEALQHLRHEKSPSGSDLVLQDGRRLVLPPKLAANLSQELEELGWAEGVAKLPPSQLYRLNTLTAALPKNSEWRGDTQLLDVARAIGQPPPYLDPADCEVRAELRPYQWLGVCWLQHLRRTGCNGLLADDMGLGKTLQVLAHLSLEQRQGRLAAPALIVVPTSLLHNWAHEVQRFCPHLSVQVMHGGQRHGDWDEIGTNDIVLTSYALVVRDQEHWRQQPLSWIILDEAQAIKNPKTQASQAVRSLDCPRRVCLSGTPVENHLGELHALLDFLMPGVLGSSQQFRRHYRRPIEEEGDEARLHRLLEQIAPLMLRRTKNEVAQDLPSKTRIEQCIPLMPEQRTFYQQVIRQGRQTLEHQLAQTDNDGQKQMLVLTALTRLRQACCDPALLGHPEVPSAKRRHCLAMVRELVEEGRTVLIFSQFTAMLALLARDFAASGIDTLQLTGQTRNRAGVVSDFQAGKAPVFLISLKAGGVGLNLTRADSVIHFDPWWNAAAEAQASDRAHRLGQHQPVFVYQLISEDTIEERIARMQQAKAALTDQVHGQARASADAFALTLENAYKLWHEETFRDA